MPDWTATKSGKNVQRVDVVVPQGKITYKAALRQTADVSVKGVQSNESQVTGNNHTDYKHLWQPDNLHENLPNTLGWAMIQYKTGAEG